LRETETILGLISERGKKGLPLERLYRLLFNRDLYLTAYGKIYRNAGIMTHGVTDETPDGMSEEKINTIIELLRYERYDWLPTRRVSIPKKNGKKRPLGLPTWSDKLVQEVIRMLLNAYYDPQFSDHSYGFRPERGCHTALREIYYKWHGMTWFIEGDISQCYDTLDHELLIKTLEEKIHDGRFIRLIRKLLDAGYMEEWTFNQTLSGVPQGGIVSPLLSNILLDKLDKFVETVLIPQHTKGEKRRANPEYHRLMQASHHHRKQGDVRKAEELKDKAQKLPAMMTDDPDFRRLKYVRYADDFLLGFIGPKSEAEAIKQQLRKFLQEELKLELSEEKTLITHARSEAARFLGYEIIRLHEDAKQTKRRTASGVVATSRSINQQIGLRVPEDILKAKCERYMENGKAKHRAELLEVSDYTTVLKYQLEYRGIANYYRLANNMYSLRKLKWVMETSLTKTLASKYKIPMSEVYEKYGAKMEVEGKEYKVLQATIPRRDKPPLVATWGAIPLKWEINATLKDNPTKVHIGRTELEQRLLADFCELCLSDKNREVHHVRAMRKLHEYPGRPKPEWVKRMIAMRRKTIVLCERCHEAIEHGLPITWNIVPLEDVFAKRKAILESRVR
jgi:group II intron reverse transcriptase/maturase